MGLTPQLFNEALGQLKNEVVECAVCPATDSADNMVWFGDTPVCPIHAPGYREEHGGEL